MKSSCHLFLLLLIACSLHLGCQKQSAPAVSLSTARQNFHTRLLRQQIEKIPADVAPPKVFLNIKYPASAGDFAAYLTPNPGDGQKHPAIIWITGGDCNSIGDVWSPAPRDNDQTAAAYRKAGIVMMFPSLRGGNDNPGTKEGFFGEVDDVIAAAEFLKQQPYVDPARIYLGGHSTGGTLALLVSECSSQFRAVFAFGAVEDVSGYGSRSGFVPVNFREREEIKLRSPGYWLASIQSPTWVLEGTGGNISSLRVMARKSTNPKIHFVEIQGSSHFATLAPVNELIAQQILHDTGAECNITLSSTEVNHAFSSR